GQTATVNNVQLPETTVTIPSTGVSVRAVYQAKPGQPTSVQIGDGEATTSTPGTFVALEVPTLPAGQSFTAWVGQTGTVENPGLATTRLYVSDKPVTLGVQSVQSGDPDAIDEVINYDGEGTAPDEDACTNAGITGVTSDNVDAINSAIAALGGVTNTADIQEVVTNYAAVLAGAEANSAAFTPELFESLGVTVPEGAIDLLNAGVAAAQAGGVDAVEKLQSIADSAGKFASLASGSSVTMVASDYEAIGITGVAGANVTAYTSAVALTEASTQTEIQAVVNGYNTILAAAGSASAASLSVSDYAEIGVVVPAPLLQLVNSSVGGQPAQSINSVSKLQAMSTAAGRIIGTAQTGEDGGLTVANFAALGLDMVNATNLSDAVALIAAADVSDVSTVQGIEALLSEILTPALPVPTLSVWATLLMALLLMGLGLRSRRTRFMA
ncbi:MAG TPA: hypothetical protein VIC53_02210, partial [Wenzhouxiangella sp.]